MLDISLNLLDFSSSYVEFSLALITPVLLVMSALNGVNSWLKMNINLAVFFGSLLLIYPDIFISKMMQGEADNNLRFICALLGAYEIFSIMFPIYLLNSKDKSIFVGFFWSKIIENSMILIDCLISFNFGIRWNFKFIVFVGSIASVGLFSNIYFLTQANYERAQFHFKMFPVNRVAKIDFYMLFVIGLVYLAYPNTVMQSLGLANVHQGHATLFRLCGIVVLSTSFVSHSMPSFLFEKDKLQFILCRINGAIIELIAYLFSYFHLGVLSTNCFLILVAINLLYQVFISFGYFACQSKIREFKQQLENSSILNDSNADTTTTTTATFLFKVKNT